MKKAATFLVGAIAGIALLMVLGAKDQERKVGESKGEYRYEVHFRLCKENTEKKGNKEYIDKIYIFDKATGNLKMVDDGIRKGSRTQTLGLKFEEITTLRGY